jgi:hypothetical protein
VYTRLMESRAFTPAAVASEGSTARRVARGESQVPGLTEPDTSFRLDAVIGLQHRREFFGFQVMASGDRPPARRCGSSVDGAWSPSAMALRVTRDGHGHPCACSCRARVCSVGRMPGVGDAKMC